MRVCVCVCVFVYVPHLYEVCVCEGVNVMWVWFGLFRDLRLRQHLGTRYDTRRGVFDWDYHMKLTEMVWREGGGGEGREGCTL